MNPILPVLGVIPFSRPRLSVQALCLSLLLLGLLALAGRAQQVIVQTFRAAEEGDPRWDADGVKNGVFVFGAGKTHVINISCEIYNDL